MTVTDGGNTLQLAKQLEGKRLAVMRRFELVLVL